MATVLMTGDDVPDGPWSLRLTLQSGRVRRTTTGTLTFKPGGLAALDSPLPFALAATGILAGIAVIILASVIRRRRIQSEPSAIANGEHRVTCALLCGPEYDVPIPDLAAVIKHL